MRRNGQLAASQRHVLVDIALFLVVVVRLSAVSRDVRKRLCRHNWHQWAHRHLVLTLRRHEDVRTCHRRHAHSRLELSAKTQSSRTTREPPSVSGMAWEGSEVDPPARRARAVRTVAARVVAEAAGDARRVAIRPPAAERS